jgi:penicillin-binding protein 1A
VFPNDGIRIAPHYIRRVEQADGQPLQQATPEVREVISLDIAREMMVLLQAVVQHGTGAAANALHHAFGGKTGTTNNYTDAWFVGFSPSITCGTWIGFDNRQTLGEKETGAKAALPMWMDFMKVAVADKPNEEFSKANAPKRQIEVPMTPRNAVEPVVNTPVDPSDNDDEPETPAAAPVPKVKQQSTPQPVPGEPISAPFSVDLPNDKPHGGSGPAANGAEPQSYPRSYPTPTKKVKPIQLP